MTSKRDQIYAFIYALFLPTVCPICYWTRVLGFVLLGYCIGQFGGTVIGGLLIFVISASYCFGVFLVWAMHATAIKPVKTEQKQD